VIKTIARWLLALGLLALVGRQLQQGLVALGPRHLDPGWLAASFLALGVGLALGPVGWGGWVRALGVPMRYDTAFRTLYQASAAKYVPGSVWQFVGRVALAERAGVPARTAATALALDVATNFGGALVALFPPLVVFVGWGLRLLPGCEPKAVWRLLGVYAVVWGLFAVGAACLARAIAPLGPDAMAQVAGAFVVAWVAGTVAIVAPAGLGVREWSLAFLLGPVIGPGMAALLALALRAWLVAGEMVALVVALAMPVRPDCIIGQAPSTEGVFDQTDIKTS
jgi:hypothetical protein